MVEPFERTTALIALRHGRTEALSAALAGMGQALPAMGRFTEVDGLVLARAAPHQVFAMRAGVDVPLMAELSPVLAEAGLVDLSDSRVGVRLSGAGAMAHLAHLVPLDLHAGRFGPGQCAQTILSHLTVLLLQHGPDSYELQCGRSFAGSFMRALAA